MEGLNTYRCHGTAQGILNTIQVYINPRYRIFGKTGSMCNSLNKIPLLVNKNVFESDAINKWIVYNVDPNILRKVIFMKTDDTISLEITILLGVSKCIPTMPAFCRAVIRMRIEVDTIDLGERNDSSFVPAFSRTF